MNLFGKSLIHSDIICYYYHNDFTGTLGYNNHLINVLGVIKAIRSVYRGAVNSVVTTTKL